MPLASSLTQTTTQRLPPNATRAAKALVARAAEVDGMEAHEARDPVLEVDHEIALGPRFDVARDTGGPASRAAIAGAVGRDVLVSAKDLGVGEEREAVLWQREARG
mgnify:CR=1 FL=1